ncbi:hypothetical protein TIFTF001_017529 [Ficus carica]|uniref:Retrotransposon gag domain-containing protein n=1 Tax=Ficus carica TaxID=3494 RepID=A0AA88D732_FICCA|nr:hypothetical protein TIFTF001_017529 [Ficus carica]
MLAEMVDIPPTGGLEDAEDTNSYVEAPAPHQPKAQNQELPPPPAIPAQPAASAVPATQAAQPVVRQEPLYERFRRMKPLEFEGSTDHLEAEEWLTSLQIVLNFMYLTEQEKEFNDKFYNRMAMKAQQNEFNNIKQGSMSVIEAVRKFDQLARLCPHLVLTEDERVRRMLDMFHPEIAVVIDSGERPPTIVAECVERALRVKYRLAQAKQDRANFFEEKKKYKLQSKQNQGNQPNSQGNRSNLNGNHSNQNHNKRKGNFNGNNNQKNHPQKKNNTVYPTCPKCGKKHQESAEATTDPTP